MSVYKERVKKMAEWMRREGVFMAMFDDFEPRRDSSLRWLSGQPGDALLFVSAEGKTLLFPWDTIMASS
ncbi:MAG: aminopeptidase P family protein, partial [Treponema sp.]|nr:aminopeptidase P family protein [Treponema sp.]